MTKEDIKTYPVYDPPKPPVLDMTKYARMDYLVNTLIKSLQGVEITECLNILEIVKHTIAAQVRGNIYVSPMR